jgi:hypothetical protein
MAHTERRTQSTYWTSTIYLPKMTPKINQVSYQINDLKQILNILYKLSKYQKYYILKLLFYREFIFNCFITLKSNNIR